MLDTSVIQASSGQAAVVKGPNQTLGQDQFLNLLIAQLKNQDPLKPMESGEFIAQLAQFSQLEQTKQMTDALNTFIQRQDNANATGLVTLLGRQVTAAGSAVAYKAGTSVPLSYVLAGDASRVVVQVQNDAGVPVRTFALNTQTAGSQSIVWDGRDSAGNALPSGGYSFAVTAANTSGSSVSANTVTSGVVTAVRFDATGPVVVFDSGQTVAPSQIISVR